MLSADGVDLSVPLAIGGKREAYRVRAEVISRNMNSQFLRYGCLWLTAQCALESGDRRRCLQALRAALVISRTCGLGGYVGGKPRSLRALCGMALEEGIEVSFVRAYPTTVASRLHRSCGPQVAVAAQDLMLGSCDVMVVCGRPSTGREKVPHRLLELLAAIVAFGERPCR